MNENLSIQDKPMLSVKRTASKGLNILYQFYRIIFVLVPICLGGIAVVFSLFAALSGTTGMMVGVLVGIGIIVVGLINLIFLQFINSLITRTKAAEYFIAHMEEKYNIK